MSLKIKIAERLKAKAAGVNLSQKRIDAIVARAEKGLTDDSDDAAIDSNLDAINDLTPFKDIAALDDHERAKAKKLADDKEAARLKAIEDGKTAPADPDPNESSTDKLLRALMEKIDKQNDVIAGMQGEKVVNTNKKTAEDKLKDFNPDFRASVIADIDFFQITDEGQLNTFLDRKAEEAAKLPVNNFVSDRVTLGAGGPSGGKKEASAAEVDAAVESII